MKHILTREWFAITKPTLSSGKENSILVNSRKHFLKDANIWGASNNMKKTIRIVNNAMT